MSHYDKQYEEENKKALESISKAVNHPEHYNSFPGVEVIDLTQHLNFCRGNAVKYICRAGLKDLSKELEDLEKAKWYINKEIERLKGGIIK